MYYDNIASGLEGSVAHGISAHSKRRNNDVFQVRIAHKRAHLDLAGPIFSSRVQLMFAAFHVRPEYF